MSGAAPAGEKGKAVADYYYEARLDRPPNNGRIALATGVIRLLSTIT
jgi:hypothetical protein